MILGYHFLENLEMSVILTAVREMSDFTKSEVIVREKHLVIGKWSKAIVSCILVSVRVINTIQLVPDLTSAGVLRIVMGISPCLQSGHPVIS